MVVLAGEITTSAWVDFDRIVRDTVIDIGYDNSNVGFDGATCAVLSCIGKQSVDIARAWTVKSRRTRCWRSGV